MTNQAPRKKRKLFEHQAPWLVLTLLGVLLSCAVAGAVLSGLVGNRSAFRGHAPFNVMLAVIAVLLFTLSGFYLLRKRLFQEEFSLLRASMQSWLWAHIYLALFGTWLIILHAGYSLLTLELTSGKLALLALLATILSGLLWRLVYALVPRRAARSVGNYSMAASNAEAERLSVELEKLAAGRSPEFRQLKEHAIRSFMSDHEVQTSLARLPPAEHDSFRRLCALAEGQRNAGARGYRQKAYVRLLQSWRALHVPVTVFFILLVPVHVIMAYRLPARLLTIGAIEANSLGGFESAEACENCHAAIVEEWRGSLHARAMSRPTMIAQTNLDLKTTLKGTEGPDPKDLCINCHGPIGAALTSESTLPLVSKAAFPRDQHLLNEGISCVVCHQYDGKSFPGHAALSSFKDGYGPPRHYYGPRPDPVANSFHQSSANELFESPEQLCQNCHSVNYDLTKDGRIKKGEDLVLQTIFEEWEHYRQQGGTLSCVDCHMPVSDRTRSAEAAWVPFEQDHEAPGRQVREHTFIGADHRLDIPESEDPHAAQRRKFLETAASLSIDKASIKTQGSTLSFNVDIANVGVGHRLPGGFAFMRQLWFEVKVLDAAGAVLQSSGTLASPEHDLCDADMFTGISKSVLPFTLGCNEPDLLLVNFQTVLLDHIEVAKDDDNKPILDSLGHPTLAPTKDAEETFLQHFTGGPIARVRGFDRKPVPPLDPGEQRSFGYRFDLGESIGSADSVQVKLLFRAFAPYFLRALGKGQPATEQNVAPLTANLRIDELRVAKARISQQPATADTQAAGSN